MTVKQILAIILLIPITVILLAFIVANRTFVRLALNPFNPEDSAFSFTAPFFIWLFVFLAIGILIGGFITWVNQHKYRKAAREQEHELAACRAKLQEQIHLPMA